MNQVTLKGTLKLIMDRKEKVTIIMVNVTTSRKSSDIQVALFGHAMHQIESLAPGAEILIHGYVTSNLSKDGSKVYNGIGASDVFIAPREGNDRAVHSGPIQNVQSLGKAPIGQAVSDDDIPF